MALRFMQVFIPDTTEPDLDQLLEGREILGTWRDASVEDRRVINLLIPADETEPIMDRLEQAYADAEGFSVVLLPVEAVLPRPAVSDAQGEIEDEAGTGAENSITDPGRVSREELYSDLTETLGVNRVFIAMTILSAIVAAVGLLRNDVVVIIGAMVIAPLLGPNVAMSLATTLGDLDLLRHALLTNIAGIALALLVAIMVGVAFSIDPLVPSISGRTEVSIGDLALALAAGSAGTFAFTRGLAGAVIGVMVAVALMPPLVTLGILLGDGQFEAALGALLLFAANIICINLAGVATFLAQGVRPRTWWEEERARRATRIAIFTWFILLVALGAILYITNQS